MPAVIPADQLPPALRRQLGLPPKSRRRVSAPRVESAVSSPVSHRQAPGWRCHRCGYTSTTLTGARGIETHCHAEGHVRYDIIVSAT